MVPLVMGEVPVAMVVVVLFCAKPSSLGSSPGAVGVIERDQERSAFSGSLTVPVTGIGAFTVALLPGEVMIAVGASTTVGSKTETVVCDVPTLPAASLAVALKVTRPA